MVAAVAVRAPPARSPRLWAAPPLAPTHVVTLDTIKAEAAPMDPVFCAPFPSCRRCPWRRGREPGRLRSLWRPPPLAPGRLWPGLEPGFRPGAPRQPAERGADALRRLAPAGPSAPEPRRRHGSRWLAPPSRNELLRKIEALPGRGVTVQSGGLDDSGGLRSGSIGSPVAWRARLAEAWLKTTKRRPG